MLFFPPIGWVRSQFWIGVIPALHRFIQQYERRSLLNNRELPRVGLLWMALGGWHTFSDVPRELTRVMSSKRVWSVCRYDYTSQRCRTVRVEIPER